MAGAAQCRWERRLDCIRRHVIPPDRAVCLWARLFHVACRARRLRRILGHGLAYMQRWVDLQWKPPRPARQRALKIEEEDPEMGPDPADVIDAADLARRPKRLMIAGAVLSYLCIRTIVMSVIPACYMVYVTTWGLLKAVLGYVLHIAIVGLLETTYVRRLVLTFVAMLLYKLADWLGLLPEGLQHVGQLIHAPAVPLLA